VYAESSLPRIFGWWYRHDLFFSQGGYLELDLGIVSAARFSTPWSIAIPSNAFCRAKGASSERASFWLPPFLSGALDLRDLIGGQGRRKSVSAAVDIFGQCRAVMLTTAIGIVIPFD